MLVALVLVMNTRCRNNDPDVKAALLTAIDPYLLADLRRARHCITEALYEKWLSSVMMR
ncbi:hypothetical protein [Pseudomonas cannabina]|uniref:hypothetical protein n=1 Tax=Pseudomonas cannabina TaxID=86840 RepID=UPI001C8130E3|nr:hypothetical protein [Pseudomonas cannabina]